MEERNDDFIIREMDDKESEINNEINLEEADDINNVVRRDEGEGAETGEERKKRIRKEVFSWIRVFAFAIILALVVDNFIIINANVPSGSMEKTIMTGDRIIGSRLTYKFSKPKRGDIIIFYYPDDESQTFIKRVIGLPGETVRIENAKIYIDDSDTPLVENYLPEEWTVGCGDDEPLIYEVPKDSYFVLGDNRNHSKDARYWTNKFVHESKIVAKAEFVYWPFSDFTSLRKKVYEQ